MNLLLLKYMHACTVLWVHVCTCTLYMYVYMYCACVCVYIRYYACTRGAPSPNPAPGVLEAQCYMYTFVCTNSLPHFFKTTPPPDKFVLSTYYVLALELSGEKEEQKMKSENKVSENRPDDTSPDTKDKESTSSKEVGIKRSISGTKRRRSEDELELHPTIDWEEEGEGGGREGEIKEGGDKLSSRKHSRRSGESRSLHRNIGGEPKISRTSTGDKEGEIKEKKRAGKKGLVSAVEEKVDKEDSDLVPPVKHTRGVKVCLLYTHPHIHVQFVNNIHDNKP